MKTRLFILAAMICLVASCGEKVEPEVVFHADYNVVVTNNVNITINGAPMAFNSGDRMLAWFDYNVSVLPDLVLKYEAGSWKTDTEAKVSGLKPNVSGAFKAAYISPGESYKSLVPEASLSTFLYFPGGLKATDVSDPAQSPLFIDFRNSTYTYAVADNYLSITLNKCMLHSCLCISIENDDNKMTGEEYLLVQTENTYAKIGLGLTVCENNILGIGSGYQVRVYGFPMSYGYAFYFDNFEATNETIKFQLVSQTYRVYEMKNATVKTNWASENIVDLRLKSSDFK